MFQRFVIAAAAAVLVVGVGAARAAPPPVEAYGKLPQAEGFNLSPSGKRVAFVGDSADGRAAFVLENGKLIGGAKITDKSSQGQNRDAKIRHIDWADEDHVVVWTSKTYNLGMDYGFQNEIDQVLVVNLKTKKGSYVFEKDPHILNGVLGGYGYTLKGGHVYGLFRGQPLDDYGHISNEGAAVFQVDLDDGRASRVATDTENPREWLFAPDGTILANAEYDKIRGDWRLYAGPHRGAQLAQNNNKFDSAGIEGQGRTPGTILYLTQDADGGGHVFEAPLTGVGQPTELFTDLEAAGPLFDRETHLLIGALSGGNHPDATFFDAHREAVWRGVKKAFPGLNVELVSYNGDFNSLFVETDGDDDSGTFWIVDIQTGKAEPFSYAYPDVKANDVGPRKYVEYKSADGLAMEGVLTLPPGRDAKNLPVVVIPHGGPRANDDLSFDWWAEAFASRGYAVFQPNYRGSTGYGAEFVQAGYGEWGKKMQTDVSDGLAYLASQGIVDPKRASIVGGSYGGYAALAGVTVQHGLYRCAVSVAGVADLRAMLSDEAYKNDAQSPEVRYWKTAMGARSLGDSALRDISPANLASKADAPILLIHGKDDTTVPIEQSRIMERALKSAGKPVEFVVLEGEDHYLSREATRVSMLKAAVAFVEKYNPPN
jgi:dipeptidyl aminopeptidase/acylaminoacyl peptidase